MTQKSKKPSSSASRGAFGWQESPMGQARKFKTCAQYSVGAASEETQQKLQIAIRAKE